MHISRRMAQSNISACNRAKRRFRYNKCTGRGETVIAKYATTIDEDTLHRILALPGRISSSAFMRKAVTIFVEKLEKNLDPQPGNFIITHTARKETADKKGK